MGSPLQILQGVRCDEIVRQSCAQKVPMDVLLWETREGVILRGRLLRMAGGSGDRHLLAEVSGQHPLERRKVVGLRAEVVLQFRGERYAFQSMIQVCGVPKRKGGSHLHVLVLKYPRSLENRQRRADYRMQLDAGHPVTVAFCEGDMEGPFRQGIWYSGLAQDISAGGVAILTYQTLDSVMECGSSVQMSFQLPGEEDHVDIAGIIRHCRPCEEEEEEDEVPVVGSVLGVEFVPEEGSQEAVRQIDVIRRFVVARQREGLRKLRLL